MYKKINFYKTIGLFFIVLTIFTQACVDLDKAPLDRLSTASFWTNESDAQMALTGVYRSSGTDFWGTHLAVTLDAATDNGYNKNFDGWHFALSGDMNPEEVIVSEVWSSAYNKIAKCNNFLENISNVDIDETMKEEMIAEVKFIRSYQYFWLTHFFGDVPLVTKVLTLDEANSVLRDPKAKVVDFIFSELSVCIGDLPDEPKQKGRVAKAAALAMKGRLEMSEKQWSDAAASFKQIMDMNIYSIDPDYENLFLEDGEHSDEIILAVQKVASDYNWGGTNQRPWWPFQYGGYGTYKATSDLVDAYLVTDGKTIDESSLYNPENPLENRDPRMYYSLFLPGITEFKGKTYEAHPDSPDGDGDRIPNNASSGYIPKKFVSDNENALSDYASDIVMIRYAEVLLNYLEAQIEAGNSIDQSQLDATINKLRLRTSVNLPIVTETNASKLKEIVRNERRIELAFEGPLRIWDLMRWKIAHEVTGGKFYGMKLTNNPDNYTRFEVDENGNVFCMERVPMEMHNYLWPVPQSEIDINSNLSQNEGY